MLLNSVGVKVSEIKGIDKSGCEIQNLVLDPNGLPREKFGIYD